MPLPWFVKRVMDFSPEMAELLIFLWPKEFAVAYREARALPNCDVVHDGLPLRLMKPGEFMPNTSGCSKMNLHMAYALQRTLNERAIEKYQRLQANEKGEPSTFGKLT